MKYETGPWKACPCGCGLIWSEYRDYVVAKVERFDDTLNGLPIHQDAVRTVTSMIEAAPDMLQLIRVIAECEHLSVYRQQAATIVARIDNPPPSKPADHRSPFEKMVNNLAIPEHIIQASMSDIIQESMSNRDSTSADPGNAQTPNQPCSANVSGK